MKLVINLEKKYFFSLLAFSLMVLGVVGVVAYGTNSPSNFGHSVGEINWGDNIPQLCLGGGCITSWAQIGGNGSGNATVVSSSGVSKIVAGYGILISPITGTGNVAINVSPSIFSSTWATSGPNLIYSSDGNIGIGVANPMAKLDVLGSLSVGNYANFNEDSYVSGGGLEAGDVDSCTGSNVNQGYTCAPSETSSCNDIINQNQERTVTCVQAKAGIAVNGTDFAISGLHVRLPGGFSLYRVTNTNCEVPVGTVMVSSTCITRPSSVSPWYLNCDGTIPYGYYPKISCPNTLI